MGDISEYRGLIFAGTLVLVAVFIISLIPTAYLVDYDEPERQPEIPDYIEATNIVAWNSTYNITWGALDYHAFYGSTYYDHFWGKEQFGHDLRFVMTNQTDKYMYMEHGDYILIIHWNAWHSQEWIHKETGTNRGTILYLAELEEDLNGFSSTEYRLQCEDFYMDVAVGYEQSVYNLTDAWDNNAMELIVGIDWDQMGTTHDAFSLVASLISLEPTLTGNLWIDTLIKIPLMIAMIYIAFILVLRAVGALFGGGA